MTDFFQPIDSLLRTEIGHFLATLKDPDLNVRRVALVAFNSAAHNKPTLIRDLLREVLPQVLLHTLYLFITELDSTAVQRDPEAEGADQGGGDGTVQARGG